MTLPDHGWWLLDHLDRPIGREPDTARTARPPPISKARISSNRVPSQPRPPSASSPGAGTAVIWATGPRHSAAASARWRGRANRRRSCRAPARCAADRLAAGSTRSARRRRCRWHVLGLGVGGQGPRRASVPGGHRCSALRAASRTRANSQSWAAASVASGKGPGLAREIVEQPIEGGLGLHGLAERPRQALRDPPILPIAQGLRRGGVAPSAAQQDRRQWRPAPP